LGVKRALAAGYFEPTAFKSAINLRREIMFAVPLTGTPALSRVEEGMLNISARKVTADFIIEKHSGE